MSKIGLWSDSVNFPNLPLMKISAYHKSIGDSVELIKPFGEYDKVYLSKVFNLPRITKIPYRPPAYFADEHEWGGTGYAIEIRNGKEYFNREKHKDLPPYIEYLYPDYDLYPQFSEAYGYLTRGCPRGCPFCVVGKKEGIGSRKVADLQDIWHGQSAIKLLDPNILAYYGREELLDQLVESGTLIDFTHGLDARYIDKGVVERLNRMRIASIHFAFDMMKSEGDIIRGLTCFTSGYNHRLRDVICYILTNYNTTHEEDWYRVCRVREFGIKPDIRIYQKGTEEQFLTDLARWCNNPRIYYSCEFRDFVPRSDGYTCGELYGDIIY